MFIVLYFNGLNLHFLDIFHFLEKLLGLFCLYALINLEICYLLVIQISKEFVKYLMRSL